MELGSWQTLSLPQTLSLHSQKYQGTQMFRICCVTWTCSSPLWSPFPDASHGLDFWRSFPVVFPLAPSPAPWVDRCPDSLPQALQSWNEGNNGTYLMELLRRSLVCQLLRHWEDSGQLSWTTFFCFCNSLCIKIWIILQNLVYFKFLLQQINDCDMNQNCAIYEVFVDFIKNL